MAESRFISLTSYCLVEYMFEPIGSLNFLNDNITLLQNNKSGVYQIYNEDGSFSSTKNIKDLTAISLGNNTVVYADSEKVPNYTDYDDDMTETTLSGWNVVYDRVRFHFVAGFDFEGFEAIILAIMNKQNNGENHLFANILLAPDNIGELITFNSKPLFLSDSQFDRYIDILVPSIKNINQDFSVAPVPGNTFAAAITPTDSGYSGFITNAPISISLSECSKRNELATDVGIKYDTFEISENYDASVSQTNEFDDVGTSISESSNGDFIEYYLTWNGGFPEELISILNKRNPNDDWVIIHQLSVFEQVGSSFINTARLVIFQEEDWDEPLVYRPILKNAGSAVSMSIDLLSRLTNRRNGEQIIREASFSLISPKKYGRSLNVIPLSDEPQSQKVYNKIIKKDFEATKLFIEPTFAPGFNGDEIIKNKPVKSVEYVPVFFSNNNISVSNNSGITKTRDISDEIIYGPGKLKFILSPFDNAIKLKLFNVINNKAVPLDLNLTGAKYRMVFETDSGKIKVDNEKSSTSENLSIGEISFKVSQADSESMFKSDKQTVYITSVSQDGVETLMYTGEWRRPTQQDDVDSAKVSAKESFDEVDNREAKITAMEEKIAMLIENENKRKFTISRNNIIKKKATPAAVNRYGMPSPKKIRTEVSNAGKKSGKKSTFSKLAKKISYKSSLKNNGRSIR
jgi:hypothetical protein